MTETTVFVDDAVLGRFPPVCVKHGDATDDWATVVRPVGHGGLGALWLLVLLGPVGIVALLVLSVTRTRDNLLTVRLPCCEATTERFNSLKRSRRLSLLCASALLGLTVVAGANGPAGLWRYLTVALGLATVLAVVEASRDTLRCRRETVGLGLDASRRWVTLTGVHPNFRSAVQHDGADTIRHRD